jgi:hypothetical protein
VLLGLRTLETWVDSLNPEFLEPAMAEVRSRPPLTRSRPPLMRRPCLRQPPSSGYELRVPAARPTSPSFPPPRPTPPHPCRWCSR